jgi:hypothetical protein
MFQGVGGIVELIFCFLGSLKCDFGVVDTAVIQEDK